MPKSIFGCLWFSASGAGCPHHRLPKLGRTETVSGRGTRDTEGAGDTGSTRRAQQVWMREGAVQMPRPPLIPHPRSPEHTASSVHGLSAGTRPHGWLVVDLTDPRHGPSDTFCCRNVSVSDCEASSTRTVLPFKNGTILNSAPHIGPRGHNRL